PSRPSTISCTRCPACPRPWCTPTRRHMRASTRTRSLPRTANRDQRSSSRHVVCRLGPVAIEIVYETHSTTVDNEQGRATGWLSGELSARGGAEARELGDRRRTDGIAAVFSSDLGRAVETVSSAFGGGFVPVSIAFGGGDVPVSIAFGGGDVPVLYD